MSDKVKLTKEQAEKIKSFQTHHTNERIVSDFVKLSEESQKEKGFTTDTLIRALYIGYEVEQTAEEQLLKNYEETLKSEPGFGNGYRAAMRETLDIIGMKVKGINA